MRKSHRNFLHATTSIKLPQELATVKESLKEGEKAVLSPMELKLSEVIKQFEDVSEDVQMGNTERSIDAKYCGEAVGKRGRDAAKKGGIPRNPANKKRRCS